MSEPTRGPWRVMYPRTVMTPNHGVICDPATWMGGNEADANAYLIAAAPELFAACKRALLEILRGEMTPELQKDLEAAIKKARGNL